MSHPRGEPKAAAARATVLHIEDDPVVATLVRGMLRRHGFELSWHANGAEGLKRAHLPPAPDVVLLDIELPDMSGIELCRHLRAIPGLRSVPVMFCSAGAKELFIELGFQAGASDYLEKPFTEAELVARVDNLARMARSQKLLRDTLEEVQRSNELLANELDAARRVQGALLPVSLAPHPSIEAAVLYEPMVGIGGDFYDVSVRADGAVRLLIADVSGHGVFAALLAAFFKMGYQVYSDREESPARVLGSIHREFLRSLDSGHFVTALAAIFDPVDGRLRYASGGHAPGIVRRRDGRIELLQPTGPVIGLVEGSRFVDAETRLEPGDALLLLTDGVIEAPGTDGEPFGLPRTETVLLRNIAAHPAELLQNLRIDLDEFQDGAPPEDDVTALVVEWRPVPSVLPQNSDPAASFPHG